MRNQQSAVALITVIILLLLLSSLFAVMVSLVNLYHDQSNMLLQGARAEIMAQVGLSWGKNKVAREGVCEEATLYLQGFKIKVECSKINSRQGLRIVSETSGGQGYIVREMKALLPDEKLSER